MEDINHTLSQFSDWCYGSGLTVYVIGAILLVSSLAAKSTVKPLPARSKALVGAGGPAIPESRTPGRVVDESAAKLPFGERMARAGYAVVVLGAIGHIASIVLRGLAAHRVPWGNMYEFISIMCATGVVAGLITLHKRQYRPLMAFVLVPVVILLFFGGTELYTQTAPVVPALKSYWLAIHVSIVSVGSGIFLVSGVASVLFLLQREREDPTSRLHFRGRAETLMSRVPGADVLDRFAYKTVIVAFPLFSLGVIFGAVWAESAWGRPWGWDPKETCSFIAWVIYAAYLHARSTAGWRNGTAAWLNIAGFVAMLFNTFIINLVVSGLHSYAGL